jgi:hypothetical protein
MPEYIVIATKVLKDGKTHTIRETSQSRVKAEWASAHYVAAGYTVTITEEEKD